MEQTTPFEQYVTLIEKRQTLSRTLEDESMQADVQEAFMLARERLDLDIMAAESDPELPASAAKVGTIAMTSLTQLTLLEGILQPEELAQRQQPHREKLAQVVGFLLANTATYTDPDVKVFMEHTQKTGFVTFSPMPKPVAVLAETATTKPDDHETELSLADKHFPQGDAAMVVAFLDICRGELGQRGITPPSPAIVNAFLDHATAEATSGNRSDILKARSEALTRVFELLNDQKKQLEVVRALDAGDPRCAVLEYILSTINRTNIITLQALAQANRELIITYDLPKRGGVTITDVVMQRDGIVVHPLAVVPQETSPQVAEEAEEKPEAPEGQPVTEKQRDLMATVIKEKLEWYANEPWEQCGHDYVRNYAQRFISLKPQQVQGPAINMQRSRTAALVKMLRTSGRYVEGGDVVPMEHVLVAYAQDHQKLKPLFESKRARKTFGDTLRAILHETFEDYIPHGMAEQQQ